MQLAINPKVTIHPDETLASVTKLVIHNQLLKRCNGEVSSEQSTKTHLVFKCNPAPLTHYRPSKINPPSFPENEVTVWLKNKPGFKYHPKKNSITLEYMLVPVEIIMKKS